MALIGCVSACISSERAPLLSDTSITDTVDQDTQLPEVTPSCTSATCTPEGPCQDAECVDGMCRQQPKPQGASCGDELGDVCQAGVYTARVCDREGRCQAAGSTDCAALATQCFVGVCALEGCRVEEAPAGTPCVAPGGQSQSCDGLVWHAKDACDGEGTCVDGGSQTCQELPCAAGVCTPQGCLLDVAARQGQACQDVSPSGVCEDGVWHHADICEDGVCLDQGAGPCPLDPPAFCERTQCISDTACASVPIGLGTTLSAAWRFVSLLFDGDQLVVARGVQSFADGEHGTSDVTASHNDYLIEGGPYCTTADGGLTFLVGTSGDGASLQYDGQISASDELLVATSLHRPTLHLAIAPQPQPTDAIQVGRYHLAGLVHRQGQLVALSGFVDARADCSASTAPTGEQRPGKPCKQRGSACPKRRPARPSSTACRTQKPAGGIDRGANDDTIILTGRTDSDGVAPDVVILARMRVTTVDAFDAGDYRVLGLRSTQGNTTSSLGQLRVGTAGQTSDVRLRNSDGSQDAAGSGHIAIELLGPESAAMALEMRQFGDSQGRYLGAVGPTPMGVAAHAVMVPVDEAQLSATPSEAALSILVRLR